MSKDERSVSESLGIPPIMTSAQEQMYKDRMVGQQSKKEIPDFLRKNILQEAEALINGPRKKSYGDVKESFGRIASLASLITGKVLSPEDIAWIMISVKISRQINKSDRDNLVDICGYTGLLGQLLGEE